MSYYVVGITIGMAIGLAIGLSLGISIGKKQKPWSELSDEEKRQRKFVVTAGIIILIIGALTGLWKFLSY
jgi:hypothetical protein